MLLVFVPLFSCESCRGCSAAWQALGGLQRWMACCDAAQCRGKCCEETGRGGGGAVPTLLPNQYNSVRLSWQWVAVGCARWTHGATEDTRGQRVGRQKKRVRRYCQCQATRRKTTNWNRYNDAAAKEKGNQIYKNYKIKQRKRSKWQTEESRQGNSKWETRKQ